MITKFQHFNEEKSLVTLNLNDELRKGAENGDLKHVQDSLSAGAEIHHLDDNALRVSAINGHLDVVKYLISQGAIVNLSLLNKIKDNNYLYLYLNGVYTRQNRISIKFESFVALNEYRNQLEIPFDDKHPLLDKPEHVDIVDAMITMNKSKKYPNFDDKDSYDYSYYFNTFKKEAFEKWVDFEQGGGGINITHNFFYSNSDYTDGDIYNIEAISEIDFDEMDEEEVLIELSDNLDKYLTDDGLTDYKQFIWSSFLEEIEDNLRDIEKNIDENGFLPIYRAIVLKKNRGDDDTRSRTFLYDTMTENNIGNCWTYDHKMSFAEQNLSKEYYTFEGLIAIDDINWVQTICRSGWNLKDEEEVYIDKGKPIKLIGIENPEGKELKLPHEIIIEA